MRATAKRSVRSTACSFSIAVSASDCCARTLPSKIRRCSVSLFLWLKALWLHRIKQTPRPVQHAAVRLGNRALHAALHSSARSFGQLFAIGPPSSSVTAQALCAEPVPAKAEKSSCAVLQSKELSVSVDISGIAFLPIEISEP